MPVPRTTHRESAGGARRIPRGRLAAIVGLLLVLSLPPRLVRLDLPLLEKNSFRQTQTALTAKVFSESGIDLLHYKTPLFGPPWRVPFELPLFQATAALVSEVLPQGIAFDAACRLTAVLFFYLSAAALMLVCLEVLQPATCVWILAVYLFSPFDVIYSRTCLIDYSSVAFALLYLLAVLKWLRSPQPIEWAPRLAWCLAAVVAGSLAATVKVTTVPIVVPALVLLTLRWLLAGPEPPLGLLRLVRRRIDAVAAVQLLAMTAIPCLVALLWIRHTDQIKSASMLTRWLESGALGHWMWGEVSQRLVWRNWSAIGARAARLMAPGALVLIPFVALVRLRFVDAESRLLVVGLALGWALPLVLFLQLYVVHEYYLIALAPAVAVIVGVGLEVLTLGHTIARRLIGVCLVALACSSIPSAYWREVRPALTETEDQSRVLAVAHMVTRAMGGEKNLVMTQPHSNWSPTIPYYSGRRLCILRNRSEVLAIDELLAAGGFRYALLFRNNPLRLERWRKSIVAAAGEYDLYRLSYRGSPTAYHRHASKPLLVFSSMAPGAIESLVAARQVRISSAADGIVIDALARDAFFLVDNLDLAGKQRVSIDLEIDAPAPARVKVYFTTSVTHRYSEELYVEARLRVGSNRTALGIPHPEVRDPLRFDLEAAPGRYLLRRLEVRTEPLIEDEEIEVGTAMDEPAASVFADGFETGSTSSWSLVPR